MSATSDSPTYSFKRRSVVFAALFALLGAMTLVVGVSASQASSDGPTVVGDPDNDPHCTEGYFVYTQGDPDWFLVCSSNPVNNVHSEGHGEGQSILVPGLRANFLHTSCSDAFDDWAGTGFDSAGGSDLAGLLIASTDGTAAGNPMFRLERVKGSGGGDWDELGCQNIEFPEEREEFEIELVKVWTGDEFDDSDLVVTLTADPDSGLVEGDEVDVTEEVSGLPEDCTYTSDAPFTYTVDSDDADEDGVIELEVTNEVTCEVEEVEVEVGTITITKDVAGDQAPADAEFVFAIDCGEEFSESGIELGDGGEYTTEEIEAGTECTVTETDTGDALIVTVDGAGGTSTDVTVPDDDTVTVAFVNDFGDEGVLPGGPGDQVDDEEDDVEQAVLPVAIDAGTGGLANTGMPLLMLALMALGALMLGGGTLAARQRL